MGEFPFDATGGVPVPPVIADAYDMYAGQLYAYCRFLLFGPGDALDALEDTFLVAVARLEALPPGGQLGTWLFAVARNQCLRRGGPRPATTAPGYEPGEAADALEGRELLRAAVEGLAPGERDLIAMLWHGLEIDDIAVVLGISREDAFSLLSQAIDQLETATAALLVARSGRSGCADLRALLGDWDGQLSAPLTRKISKHTERCRACSARRRDELRPALLLSLTPGALLGVGVTAEALRPTIGTVEALRDQVLTLACDPSPEADEARGRACRRVEPFGKEGFPRPLSAKAGGVRRSPRARIVAGLAAVAAVAVAASLTLAGGHGRTRAAEAGLSELSRPPTSASASTTSGASLPSDSASRMRSTRSPSPSAVPSPKSPSPSPSPSPAPSASTSPSPSRSSSSSSSPPARSAPSVRVPSSVALQPNRHHREWGGTLAVTVNDGPLSWSISNPNQGLELSSESGTSSATVQISGYLPDDPQPLIVTAGGASFRVTLTISG
jgi:RNA polymerase sigma factor (sigma-70 family)